MIRLRREILHNIGRSALLMVTPYLIAVGLLYWPQFVPDSFWVSDLSIHVDDAVVGGPISVTFNRQINRAFSNVWTGQIRRIDQFDKGFVVTCSGTGRSLHEPGDMISTRVDLAWVVFPTKCELPAGKYYIASEWAVDLPLGDRLIDFRSNVFEVREAH